MQGFRKRLRAPEPMLGTFLKIPSTQPAEILGTLGFDFVVIDEEHAPLNPETTDAIMLACRAHSMAGLVRVRHRGDILRVLDSGADGVLVPHVTSPEVGREIVSLARYDPGTRGLSPTTRAGNFGSISMAEHIKSQDARCAVIAMIEDAEALDRIDEIVEIDSLDAIFVGRADLAMSMRVSPQEGAVDRAVSRILAASQAIGMPALVLAGSSVEVKSLRAKGATGFLTGSDQGFLRASAASARAAFLQ